VADFHFVKPGLAKHVLLVWMGYKTKWTYDFVRIELTSTLNKGYNANASKSVKSKEKRRKTQGTQLMIGFILSSDWSKIKQQIRSYWLYRSFPALDFHLPRTAFYFPVWVKMAQNSFQQLCNYNHSVSLDATIMPSKNCPIIGERIVIISVQQ